MQATTSDASGSRRPVSLAVTAAALALSVAILGACRDNTELLPCTVEHHELSPQAAPIIPDRCVLPSLHTPQEPHYRYGMSSTTDTTDRRLPEATSSLIPAPASAQPTSGDTDRFTL